MTKKTAFSSKTRQKFFAAYWQLQQFSRHEDRSSLNEETYDPSVPVVQAALFHQAQMFQKQGDTANAVRYFQHIEALNFRELRKLNAVMQLKANESREHYKKNRLPREAKTNLADKIQNTRAYFQKKPSACRVGQHEAHQDSWFLQMQTSLYELGIHQLRQGHRDKARHYFEQAAALPGSPDTTCRSLYFLYALTTTKRGILHRKAKAASYLSAMMSVCGSTNAMNLNDRDLVINLILLSKFDDTINQGPYQCGYLLPSIFRTLYEQDLAAVKSDHFLLVITKELLVRCQGKMNRRDYNQLVKKYCDRSQASEASSNGAPEARVSRAKASHFGSGAASADEAGLSQVPVMRAGSLA